MRFLGETSTGFINKIKNILFVFVVYALYIFLCQGAMRFMWDEGLLGLFFTLIFAPTLEELVFRVGAFGLVKNKPDLVFPMLILSSALFGWLHGGAANWLVQGVAGFVIGCVYLKNGYSYWSAVLLHFMWNLYCVTILENLN